MEEIYTTSSEERNKMSDKPTILVIDDEKAMRDSCSQVLTKEGYQTETSENGDSGLQKIREIKPDLVIVDLKMPGISGMELLEKIRYIDKNIVSVVITGYATIESAVEAMKRNAYDFLPKPFTPDQLRIITKRGLERRKLALEAESLRLEKEKIRENFITFVSHQLRSPLVSIKQYCEVILGGFAGDVASKQKDMIEQAGNRIDQLLKLVNDWLDMSRIETGNLIGKFEPIDLAPILSEIMELFRPLADNRKLKLKLVLGNNLPLIQGNADSLKQAFSNLVSNAIEYNPKGGTVTISAREQQHNLALEISDTGIGISRENLPFIFDDFFRAKTKETRDITGSGLGLPIAKKIIEAHSGSIKVTSELGKGTTFTIILLKTDKDKRRYKDE